GGGGGRGGKRFGGMGGLRPPHGQRVGLLQARYGQELAALIEREGGVPIMAPCLREVRNEDDEQLRARLRDLVAVPADVCVFQTGVGTQALFDLASAAGLADAFAESVRKSLIVARGPKPLTVLLRLGFAVELRTTAPHTTKELLWLLEGVEVTGRRVAVQHYGSANAALVDHLRDRAAEVVELFSYRWALPDDVSPILRLLDELRAGRMG